MSRGHKRLSWGEVLHLDIAQGSAGEADYFLLLACDLRYATEQQSAPLRGELDELGAMLHAL